MKSRGAIDWVTLAVCFMLIVFLASILVENRGMAESNQPAITTESYPDGSWTCQVNQGCGPTMREIKEFTLKDGTRCVWENNQTVLHCYPVKR